MESYMETVVVRHVTRECVNFLTMQSSIHKGLFERSSAAHVLALRGFVCTHGDNLLAQTMLHLPKVCLGVRDPSITVREHVLNSNQGYETGSREPANRIQHK